MRRFPSILLWSFLLVALTAIVLPSCGVSRKSGSAGQQADSLATDSERRAIWEELAGEEYGPLPANWDRAYKRRYRRMKADSLALAGQHEVTLPDSLSADSPPDIEPGTVADSLDTPVIDTGTEPARPGVTDGEGDQEGAGTEGDEEVTAGGGEEPKELKKVDFTGDIARPIHITEDSTATYLLGNVVFYHNGAVITCDSAVRFSEKRMEFYKRVVINNGTTYIYGDRAEYNGEINLARVYSPMVKVVDEDAVLYTYNFSYNTYTEVGRYWGGGTLTHKDSQMESLRGFYNTQTREFTGAGEVELTNPDYQMISDSVRYNLDTEVAEFFVPTRIWNSKGEILLADRGRYRSASDDYEFTSNSYILTQEQEMWADSMEHFATTDYTVFRRDIQIIDEENNTIAFGDYGEYWGETEHGMLTLDPSLISFDTEEPDTVYMRSDSMFFYTYPYDQEFVMLHLGTPETNTSEFEERLERPDRPQVEGEEGDQNEEDEETGDETEISGETPQNAEGEATEGDEEIPEAPDIETEDGQPAEAEPESPPEVKPSKKEQRQARKAAKKEARTEAKPKEVTEETEEVEGETLALAEGEETPGLTEGDETGIDGEETEEGDEGEEEVPEAELYVSPYGELIVRLHSMVAADSVQQAMMPEKFWVGVGEEIKEDSLKAGDYLEAVGDAMTSGEIDPMFMEVPDGGPDVIMETVIEESQKVVASLPKGLAGEDIEESDSVQRVFYGYRNVRIFRDDFQAVCDSIVGFSRDSTLHMHIEPVMWSDQNQVTSDIMIIYTRDEELYKAEFYGNPFMTSEVDSLMNQYNQIKGKFMTAWFRENDIYRHDVFGNGQTYYYMEDDDTHEVQGFMVCESADITFFIEEQTIDEIIYRGEPDYIIYPIEMIPPDVEQILPGFKWEAHRRPMQKEDVHTREIRPRRRDEVLAYPQPTFPLTESIDQRKEELTKQNIWRDRNDVLSPYALDFVREVELKYAE